MALEVLLFVPPAPYMPPPGLPGFITVTVAVPGVATFVCCNRGGKLFSRDVSSGLARAIPFHGCVSVKTGAVNCQSETWAACGCVVRCQFCNVWNNSGCRWRTATGEIVSTTTNPEHDEKQNRDCPHTHLVESKLALRRGSRAARLKCVKTMSFIGKENVATN